MAGGAGGAGGPRPLSEDELAFLSLQVRPVGPRGAAPCAASVEHEIADLGTFQKYGVEAFPN